MAQKDHEWTREKKRNGQEEEGIRIKCKHLSKKKKKRTKCSQPNHLITLF